MNTLTGNSTRTITGYLVTLLEYPRWVIEREVDFTSCHLQGEFEASDPVCANCQFGEACSWLSHHRGEPSLSTPLPELLNALQTAADYLRGERLGPPPHTAECDCDTCQWLREASNFLRVHRHRT